MSKIFHFSFLSVNLQNVTLEVKLFTCISFENPKTPGKLVLIEQTSEIVFDFGLSRIFDLRGDLICKTCNLINCLIISAFINIFKIWFHCFEKFLRRFTFSQCFMSCSQCCLGWFDSQQIVHKRTKVDIALPRLPSPLRNLLTFETIGHPPDCPTNSHEAQRPDGCVRPRAYHPRAPLGT